MVFQKRTINGVPTLVPLTADTGSGVPVGTIIGQYKKVNMSGYLYLDGSTFDETLYPALYAYLGTNVLPDYREFVLVGAEQNSTSATIATHDVFTQGQEKDDQLQEHIHSYATTDYSSGSSNIYAVLPTNSVTGNDNSTTNSGRSGTTTRTKEKAVFWYIKATTGIIESEATEVLNLYNEQNSYSTSEINTGKKWIDGKPIYRKTFSGTTVPGDYIIGSIGTYNSIVKIEGVIRNQADGNILPLNYNGSIYSYVTPTGSVTLSAGGSYSISGYAITVEYTKLTD